ncbi:unnamed protein product [Rotaria sp. Silwood2]|nr:unnamed protein product [Rotaria sp. Silwood2]CAF3152503.1 unnamed protein product [Rotaria sp. Silwood2]CAF3279351.1 unnamed protein product [Rotaria sp. Silwood2]CAF4144801.1 unnamed protein product [Rotaria sp. Silwood2]CAF4231932.1 unnamed protein product [Rotaria sp. Silwood2]
MSTELFYNCTLPWFGPICQYMFDQYEPHHSSFTEMVHDFYRDRSGSNTLTCYKHLQCIRGLFPACLDWTEICDGSIDCIDGGRDEEHCWQVEIHECQKNEYRCYNGQCIPIAFLRDDPSNPDCLDGSDEIDEFGKNVACKTTGPVFRCEEAMCMQIGRGSDTFVKKSCIQERDYLIMRAMLSTEQNFVNSKCWSAFLNVCRLLSIL